VLHIIFVNVIKILEEGSVNIKSNVMEWISMIQEFVQAMVIV